jgi:YHS domain-containing protein
MLRIRHQFTIISLGCLALCTIILSPVSGDSKDDASPPSKEVKAQIREMLSEFNSLIGGWRGAGQVRRGSTAGAWQEEGRFVWKFDGGNVGIEYRLADGKHLKSGVLSWDPKTKDFTFQAERPDGEKLAMRGAFEKNVLTLESAPDSQEQVTRMTVRLLNEIRLLVLYETRKASSSFYRRIGEVGYTREGARLAAAGGTGPVCVVSGGAGTIKVEHKGKAYYVCCTGCRDAFNEDPDGILESYFAELELRKAEQKKVGTN